MIFREIVIKIFIWKYRSWHKSFDYIFGKKCFSILLNTALSNLIIPVFFIYFSSINFRNNDQTGIRPNGHGRTNVNLVNFHKCFPRVFSTFFRRLLDIASNHLRVIIEDEGPLPTTATAPPKRHIKENQLHPQQEERQMPVGASISYLHCVQHPLPDRFNITHNHNWLGNYDGTHNLLGINIDFCGTLPPLTIVQWDGRNTGSVILFRCGSCVYRILSGVEWGFHCARNFLRAPPHILANRFYC